MSRLLHRSMRHIRTRRPDPFRRRHIQTSYRPLYPKPTVTSNPPRQIPKNPSHPKLVMKHRFDSAIQLSTRLSDIFAKLNQSSNFHKQALATVIIALGSGDDVEASKRWERFAGYEILFDNKTGPSANGVNGFRFAEPWRSAEHKRAPSQII